MPLKTEIIQSIINKPNTCPFCKSTLLDADSPKLGQSDELKVHVTCTDCLREWVEIYRIITVITVEDDENDIPPNCEFYDEFCKSMDYRSVSGNRPDDYANIPCEHYEECKRRSENHESKSKN